MTQYKLIQKFWCNIDLFSCDPPPKQIWHKNYVVTEQITSREKRKLDLVVSVWCQVIGHDPWKGRVLVHTTGASQDKPGERKHKMPVLVIQTGVCCDLTCRIIFWTVLNLCWFVTWSMNWQNIIWVKLIVYGVQLVKWPRSFKRSCIQYDMPSETTKQYNLLHIMLKIILYFFFSSHLNSSLFHAKWHLSARDYNITYACLGIFYLIWFWWNNKNNL